MNRFGPLVLGGLLLSGRLPAQTSPRISAADLQLRLTALAHDSMGGRATGSLGGFKAAEYVASEFRRLGLEPAGEQGTYFQTIPFFRYLPDSRGGIRVGPDTLRIGRDLIPLAAQTYGRPISHAEVVFGGPTSDSSQWISADAARGRIVVLGAPSGGGRGIGQVFGPIRGTTRFAEAALIIVAALDQVAGDLKAAMTDGRVVTDTTRRGASALIVVGSIRAADALLGRPVATARPGQTGPAVTGTVDLIFSPLPYLARNVVAVLPGQDPARRGTYVSISGHSDHVGFDRTPVDHDSLRAYNRVVRPMGADTPWHSPTPKEAAEVRRILDSLRAIRPARLDSIRNGADDDGTGTVALLEIAEAFSRAPLPRSILFVSHAAEEMGLLGSAWYTDHPTVPIDSIVAEIDMDMIGRGSATDLPDGGVGYLEVIGMRRLSKEYGDIFDRVNARQATPFTFNVAYDAPGHPLQYYCRADHYSYARYGIPSVALSRGEHLDYHQVTDEAQYIDYQALARVADLVADVAREVATLDHRPRLDRPKGDPKARCVQ